MQVPYKPNQSHAEMLVDQALQSAMLPPEYIRQIRPVVPQQLMPQSRGFGKQELSIIDVLMNIGVKGVKEHLNAFSVKEVRFFIWAQPFHFYKLVANI